MAVSSHQSDEQEKLKRDVKEKGQQISQGVADTVSGAAGAVAEKGQQAKEGISEVAGHMKSAVDSSLKTQPAATLAMAVGIGFILGALWKS